MGLRYATYSILLYSEDDRDLLNILLLCGEETSYTRKTKQDLRNRPLKLIKRNFRHVSICSSHTNVARTIVLQRYEKNENPRCLLY